MAMEISPYCTVCHYLTHNIGLYGSALDYSWMLPSPWMLAGCLISRFYKDGGREEWRDADDYAMSVCLTVGLA